jgi:hypothetical protein
MFSKTGGMCLRVNLNDQCGCPSIESETLSHNLFGGGVRSFLSELCAQSRVDCEKRIQIALAAWFW